MNVPEDLSDLLQAIGTDFPAILRGNLVGIYMWGSLTYDAFDETSSDVDCVGVTPRDLDDREFSELDEWFKNKKEQNRTAACRTPREIITAALWQASYGDHCGETFYEQWR